jgi:hypothetical protein
MALISGDESTGLFLQQSLPRGLRPSATAVGSDQMVQGVEEDRSVLTGDDPMQ